MALRESQGELKPCPPGEEAKRDSSTAQADAFAGAHAEEKTSARSARNDRSGLRRSRVDFLPLLHYVACRIGIFLANYRTRKGTPYATSLNIFVNRHDVRFSVSCNHSVGGA